MSFSEMKRNRDKLLGKVQEQVEKATTNKYQTDERFWYPTRDKAGNGLALIRFLPPTDGEESPFIRSYDRSFKGPTGQWYIEKDLSTLGKSDPAGEYCGKLYNSGIEANKKKAAAYGRKTYFVSNILVIKDFGKPENDGKVFLYRYGKKIFEKLNDLMNPTFAGDEKINPYDPWTGANFKLIIRQDGDYPSYDKSKFEEPSALGDDDEIEAIWNKQYKLLPLIDPKEFKSYEELKERFYKVIDEDAPLTASRKAGVQKPTVIDEDDTPPFETEPKPKTKAASTPKAVEPAEEDGEDMDYFARLAADD